MKEWIDLVFNEVLCAIGNDGGKFLRRRTAAAVIMVIQGFRKIVIIHYLTQVFCFLTAFSLFFGIHFLAEQLTTSGSMTITWTIGSCLSIFAISVGLLSYTLREKTWIRAFRIEEMLNLLVRTPKPDPQENLTIQIEDIVKIVEQVMDRKLREAAAIQNNP